LYAIIVIASCICWVSFALSKSNLAAGSNTGAVNVATVHHKIEQAANVVKDKATELTGGVKDDVKADDQANDIVKSNEL
jgi:hypothetical protein